MPALMDRVNLAPEVGVTLQPQSLATSSFRLPLRQKLLS